MRILVVLIVVFMLPGAVAQEKPTTMPNDFDSNDVVICNGASGSTTWSCKNAKTGNTLRVKCKNPSKSIMPPKDRPTVMTMAKLKKACGLLDGLEDIDDNG